MSSEPTPSRLNQSSNAVGHCMVCRVCLVPKGHNYIKTREKIALNLNLRKNVKTDQHVIYIQTRMIILFAQVLQLHLNNYCGII